MVKKIALEEHFLCPGFIEYWNPTVAEMPAAKRDRLLSRNTDFGELRLASMDKAGIERAVLALAGPGVQAEPDAATAIRTAKARQRLPGARKSRNGPTAIPASRICRCRTPRPRPTSWSAASRK